MSKCYIPEISIRTIRNDKNMNILKNNYEYTVDTKNIICIMMVFMKLLIKTLLNI